MSSLDPINLGVMIVQGPQGVAKSLKTFASDLGIALPSDGTLCKFTLVGAGAGGTSAPPDNDSAGSGGGAGGACIWFSALNENSTLSIAEGGLPASDPVGNTIFVDTVNNNSFSVGGGKISGAGGDVTPSIGITISQFITFTGGGGSAGAQGLYSAYDLLGARGGSSIFGGAGGSGGLGTTNAGSDAAPNSGSGGGGGVNHASGGKGASGIFIMEW